MCPITVVIQPPLLPPGRARPMPIMLLLYLTTIAAPCKPCQPQILALNQMLTGVHTGSCTLLAPGWACDGSSPICAFVHPMPLYSHGTIRTCVGPQGQGCGCYGSLPGPGGDVLGTELRGDQVCHCYYPSSRTSRLAVYGGRSVATTHPPHPRAEEQARAQGPAPNGGPGLPRGGDGPDGIHVRR